MTTPIRFPKLFWAGAVVFGVNAAIATGICTTPELPVTLYGLERPRATAANKPSPFEELVKLQKPSKVRKAERLRPLLVSDSSVVGRWTEVGNAGQPVAYVPPQETQVTEHTTSN